METPIWLYAFWAPVHESPAAQVMLFAVAVMIAADVLFGMVAALARGEFRSTAVREGLAHKSAEVAFLVVADVVDALLFAGVQLPFEVPSGCAVVSVGLALVLMETASLMETATRVNPALAGNPLFRVLDSAHIIDAAEAAGEEEDDG